MNDLGQFFTTDIELQQKVFELCKNRGEFLEPSAGQGDLVYYFYKNDIKCKAIEIDDTIPLVSNKINIEHTDFFDFPISNKYDTIFGNPPYVKWQKIKDKHRFEDNLNLYFYFIEKSVCHLKDGGEMVFILPREVLNTTRGKNVRKYLFDNGTITDIVDYQERKFFKKASPNIIIIRYEKNNFSHITRYEIDGKITKRKEVYHKGNLVYITGSIKETLGDYFDIRVGIVSGANSIFNYNSKLSVDIICSDYIRTKKKKKYLLTDIYSLNTIKKDEKTYKYLLSNKQLLINRKIRKFCEEDWWKWGAIRNIQYMQGKGFCLYVNSKTRSEKPFFVEKIGYYDGSILALFPKKEINLNKWEDLLNNSKQNFFEQNMYVNNKYIFQQQTLSNLIL